MVYFGLTAKAGKIAFGTESTIEVIEKKNRGRNDNCLGFLYILIKVVDLLPVDRLLSLCFKKFICYVKNIKKSI